MKIKHRKSGEVYATTPDEWRNVIVAQGNDYKFEIVEEGVPIEIKTMREKKAQLENVPDVKVKKKVKNT